MTSITPASTVRRLLARPADEGGHEGRCSTELCTWFVSLANHDEVHAAFNLHRCAHHLRTEYEPVLAQETDTAPEPEAGESANETPVRRTTTRHCSPPVSCDCDYVCEQAGAV